MIDSEIITTNMTFLKEECIKCPVTVQRIFLEKYGINMTAPSRLLLLKLMENFNETGCMKRSSMEMGLFEACEDTVWHCSYKGEAHAEVPSCPRPPGERSSFMTTMLAILQLL